MRQKKMLLVPVCVCIILFILAGCGFRQTSTSGGTSALTPTPSSSGTNTPVATITPGTVTVTPGKRQYAPGEAISVTIANGLATSISTGDHQSGCTMVTLQWQDASASWQNQLQCRQGAVTRIMTLAPSAVQVQYLSPTAGTFTRDAVWQKGVYRVVFNFTMGQSDLSAPTTSSALSPVYSATFYVS